MHTNNEASKESSQVHCTSNQKA